MTSKTGLVTLDTIQCVTCVLVEVNSVGSLSFATTVGRSCSFVDGSEMFVPPLRVQWWWGQRPRMLLPSWQLGHQLAFRHSQRFTKLL